MKAKFVIFLIIFQEIAMGLKSLKDFQDPTRFPLEVVYNEGNQAYYFVNTVPKSVNIPFTTLKVHQKWKSKHIGSTVISRIYENSE